MFEQMKQLLGIGQQPAEPGPPEYICCDDDTDIEAAIGCGWTRWRVDAQGRQWLRRRAIYGVTDRQWQGLSR